MLKKVLIFKTSRGDYCVMNVPDEYKRDGVKPSPTSPTAFPRFFPDHAAAVEEARARHGHMALIIDETH